MIPTKHTKLEEIEGLEDFSKYAIDVHGNVWTLNYRWPKIRKPILNNRYLAVKATDDNGRLRTLYIHKLVARAFIPTHNVNQRVRHKDGNIYNNQVDNLEWIINKKEIYDDEEFVLKQEILNRIKQVHLACRKKGIKTGNSYDFTHQMINTALDEYIMRYGLRKVM